MGTYRRVLYKNLLTLLFCSLLSLHSDPLKNSSLSWAETVVPSRLALKTEDRGPRSCQYFFSFELSLSQRQGASMWGEQRTEDDCLVDTLLKRTFGACFRGIRPSKGCPYLGRPTGCTFSLNVENRGQRTTVLTMPSRFSSNHSPFSG